MVFTLPDGINIKTTELITPVAEQAIEVPKITESAEAITEEAAEEQDGPTLFLADANPEGRTRPKPFYVASQWHITPGENGKEIEAVNNTTGDRYEGSIADFNDMLKGF